MPPVEEMIDVYDAEGRSLGRATSRSAHTEGLWHRSFHCWVAHQRADGVKVVLVQRRGPYKRDYPNCLDVSVAGHYQAGERVEGGIREFKEELGVSVEAWQLRRVACRTINEYLDGGTVNREFQDIYFLLEAIDPHACTPSYPEVGGVFQAPVEALARLLDGEVDTVPCHGVAFDPASGKVAPTRLAATIDSFIPAARSYLKVIMRELDSHLDGKPPSRHSGQGQQAKATVVLDDGSLWKPT